MATMSKWPHGPLVPYRRSVFEKNPPNNHKGIDKAFKHITIRAHSFSESRKQRECVNWLKEVKATSNSKTLWKKNDSKLLNKCQNKKQEIHTLDLGLHVSPVKYFWITTLKNRNYDLKNALGANWKYLDVMYIPFLLSVPLIKYLVMFTTDMVIGYNFSKNISFFFILTSHLQLKFTWPLNNECVGIFKAQR